MNRIEFAARMTGQLRREKAPPLARYAITLGAAACGPKGGTTREIANMLGEADPRDFGGSLSKIEEAGLILRLPGTVPQRYTPTPAGLALIAPLIQHSPTPA